MAAASERAFPLAGLKLGEAREAREDPARSCSMSSSSTATPRSSSERDSDLGGPASDEDGPGLHADGGDDPARSCSKFSSSTATPRSSSERDSDLGGLASDDDGPGLHADGGDDPARSCSKSSSSTATPRGSSERDSDLRGPSSDEDGPGLHAEVPRLLERMNGASDLVNSLERLAAEARARYGRRVLRFKRLYARMREEHGLAFDVAKPLFRDAPGRAAPRATAAAAGELAPCFWALQRHQAGLAREHELIDMLSQRGRAAKDVYLASMRQLEAISESEHARRQSAPGAAALLEA